MISWSEEPELLHNIQQWFQQWASTETAIIEIAPQKAVIFCSDVYNTVLKPGPHNIVLVPLLRPKNPHLWLLSRCLYSWLNLENCVSIAQERLVWFLFLTFLFENNKLRVGISAHIVKCPSCWLQQYKLTDVNCQKQLVGLQWVNLYDMSEGHCFRSITLIFSSGELMLVWLMCADLLTPRSSDTSTWGPVDLHQFLVWASLGLFTFTWFVHTLTLFFSAGEGAAVHAGLWEQRGHDTVTHLREDSVLLWCLWLELLAEAAVPEPTVEEDTGNEGMGPLSYVITGTRTGECVFVYACVCVSVVRLDGLTDRRSPRCMHDLSHSSPSNTV